MNCPACGGEELSEETSYSSFEHGARFRDWEPGIIQWKDLVVGPERARICLECGYILMFAGKKDLERLRSGRPEDDQ